MRVEASTRTSTLPARTGGTGTCFKLSCPPIPARRQALICELTMRVTPGFTDIRPVLLYRGGGSIINSPDFLFDRTDEVDGSTFRCSRAAQGAKRAFGSPGGVRPLGAALSGLSAHQVR